MRIVIFVLIMDVILVFSCFTGFSLVENCNATSNIIYVSDSNTGGPWDGTPEHPYQYIQDGIDAANPGDIVYVISGTYHESIDIDKQITLQGSNKYDAIISKNSTNNAIIINTDSVLVKEFTINGRVAISSNYVTIQDNIINVELGNCIYVSNKENIAITGNIITSDTGISASHCNDITISNNEIDCQELAIHLTFSYSNIDISNNILKNMRTGIHIQDASDLEITENIIKSMAQYGTGILFSSGTNSIITSNLIQDIPYNGHGITLYFSSNNNQIYHNTFLGGGIGRDYAHDECNNFWYNPASSRGNYWDNYRGMDSNGDGIGDTPYNIPGGDNKDMYPLGYFNNPPSKPTNPYPANGATDVEIKGGYVELKVDVFDLDGDTLKVGFYDASNDNFIDGFNIVSSGEKASGQWIELDYDTTYSWYVVISDSIWTDDGLTTTSDIFSFTTQSEPQINKLPVANASAGEPYVGFIGKMITFDGSLSYDSNGFITSWEWKFGDGMKAFGSIVTHTYSSLGTYIVTLTVTDDEDNTDTYETTAVISQLNNPPSSPQIDGSTKGNKNTGYTYTVVSTDEDNDNIKYVFDWGDGNTSESEFLPSGSPFIISHIWSNAGKYIISVQAYGNKTYSGTVEYTVLIDAINVEDIGYLIDIEGDGIYDIFHNDTTQIETDVDQDEDGKYLIDTDGDGKWDITFDAVLGLTSHQGESPGFELIFAVISVAIVLFWKRKRY